MLSKETENSGNEPGHETKQCDQEQQGEKRQSNCSGGCPAGLLATPSPVRAGFPGLIKVERRRQYGGFFGDRDLEESGCSLRCGKCQELPRIKKGEPKAHLSTA